MVVGEGRGGEGGGIIRWKNFISNISLFGEIIKMCNSLRLMLASQTPPVVLIQQKDFRPTLSVFLADILIARTILRGVLDKLK